MAKAHILIIEDEILVARELEARLKGMGYEVDGIANCAEKALQMVAEKRPDLVLMDIVLKGDVDGIVVAKEIRARLDVPSIYVTAYCDENTLERAKETEPYGYLIKPFSESELRATLEMALHKREMDRRLQQAYKDLQVVTRELRLKNEDLEMELRIAHEMQIGMLPSRFPCIPRGASLTESALHFESVYTPSGQISGDFFDIMPVSDTAAGVFICDVMGHNVSAALVTAMIRALVEEFSVRADVTDPGALLTNINKVLARVFEQNEAVVFATAFYLIADVATSAISYANAAHPSPLYLSRKLGDATPIQSDSKQGPALGLFKDVTYESRTCPMAAGDSVMLFTDGIFEVEDPGDEQYSENRLVKAVRERVQLPNSRIFSELLRDVQNFAAGREFPDDVCLVGMEVKRCG
ncbi:MAG: sensory transduction regulatory protein [Chthoniobacteraceae bacterium]|nr:sensory transduction regulatory protein [Chthoniobacteraceae bacterium]